MNPMMGNRRLTKTKVPKKCQICALLSMKMSMVNFLALLVVGILMLLLIVLLVQGVSVVILILGIFRALLFW